MTSASRWSRCWPYRRPPELLRLRLPPRFISHGASTHFGAPACARLDYRMHEGCNARALVALSLAVGEVTVQLDKLLLLAPPPAQLNVTPVLSMRRSSQRARRARRSSNRRRWTVPPPSPLLRRTERCAFTPGAMNCAVAARQHASRAGRCATAGCATTTVTASATGGSAVDGDVESTNDSAVSFHRGPEPTIRARTAPVSTTASAPATQRLRAKPPRLRRNVHCNCRLAISSFLKKYWARPPAIRPTPSPPIGKRCG